MTRFNYFISFLMIVTMIGCNSNQNELNVEVYETSAGGHQLTRLTEFTSGDSIVSIKLLPEVT